MTLKELAQESLLPPVENVHGYAMRLQWFQKAYLINYLRQITRPYILKTDDEHESDRALAKEIARAFNEQYPEDVFDRYGEYPQAFGGNHAV